MSDKDIKTMAVMIANRAAYCVATKEFERRKDRRRAALESFCEGLKGYSREVMEDHHPELFTEN